MITIKKYPNRRLYDTSKSQYINLETIKDLVLANQDFRVIDSKSEDDITKSILLQIITEQESNDQQSLLTHSVLKQLIRFYGSDMQVFMRQYIEQSITTFMERQDSFQGVMQDFMDATSPMNMFNQMLEKNVSMWQQFSPAKTPDKAPSDQDPSDDESSKKE